MWHEVQRLMDNNLQARKLTYVVHAVQNEVQDIRLRTPPIG